jgi:hypothetical protein
MDQNTLVGIIALVDFEKCLGGVDLYLSDLYELGQHRSSVGYL